MNTIQLTQIVNKFAQKTHFLGVLACDQLTCVKMSRLPLMCIINTDPSWLSGQHWVALYITSDRIGCFFDSYGKKPDHPSFPQTIYNFLKLNCVRIQHSARQVQGHNTITCGEHCLFFLCNMVNGLSYELFMRKYCDDTFRNDRLVSVFVKKLGSKVCKKSMTSDCIQCVKTR